MISFVCGTAEDRATRKEQRRARRIADKLHEKYAPYLVPQILFNPEPIGIVQIASKVQAAWKHEAEAKPNTQFTTTLIEPEKEEVVWLAKQIYETGSLVVVVHPDFFDLVFPSLSEVLGYGRHQPQLLTGHAVFFCPVRKKIIILR